MDTDARAIGTSASCVRDLPVLRRPSAAVFGLLFQLSALGRDLVAQAMGPVKSQAPVRVILNIKTVADPVWLPLISHHESS